MSGCRIHDINKTSQMPLRCKASLTNEMCSSCALVSQFHPRRPPKLQQDAVPVHHLRRGVHVCPPGPDVPEFLWSVQVSGCMRFGRPAYVP
ncbi:hypothetical protein AGOR_G00225640 [Albula goreensis]|uniref:Uncharacterized protein n=1 Tax=Albula goreensis TaxID=1534307 RepID=A0A8T3CH37_9TELE|nr:hypothetical protein AGOR_G00225640 [Albula goreensis]